MKQTWASLGVSLVNSTPPALRRTWNICNLNLFIPRDKNKLYKMSPSHLFRCLIWPWGETLLKRKIEAFPPPCTLSVRIIATHSPEILPYSIRAYFETSLRRNWRNSTRANNVVTQGGNEERYSITGNYQIVVSVVAVAVLLHPPTLPNGLQKPPSRYREFCFFLVEANGSAKWWLHGELLTRAVLQ